ncbi:MAG: DUF4307 domain-containing protein [Mycobacterium sp.]|nr:DUF4307 domain-containing protein [Mycobacterium sp.]
MTQTPAGPAPPASRYGRGQLPAATRRRIVIALGALTMLLGVGIAIGAYQRFEGVAVEGEMAAYEVLDDQTVSVTISVTRKDPAVPVVCIVRARSRDGSETGRREILVGPSGERTVQVTTTVKSYKPPYVGDIYGCGTSVPRYLTGPLTAP